ncbi:MAG: SpoIID/LytB domain-containing protein [Candidatus Velamenicoccus archaeovorus]
MVRRVPIALVVLVCAALLSVAPGARTARAADRFTFFGSGWGHGLGLSQWGAYGLAQEGWGRDRILTHFYSGTRVVHDGSAPAALRIGLVQGRQKLTFTALRGPVDLRLGDRQPGSTLATIPRGETWTVTQVGGAYRILDGSGTRVADGVGGTATDLFAVYEPKGAMVKVPQAGHTYNRGWIELNIANCDARCSMRLILTIAPQPYLYGLAEVPSSWPRPALQAQAIAARTYAFRKVALSGQHRPGCNCALYASSLDQVYAGYDKEGGDMGERWVAAVNATDGRVVTYKGDLIQAFYTSSSGGYTENNENVWGGPPIPYLRGVCDPGDFTPANPNAVWKVQMGAAQVTERLHLGIGRVTGFGNTVRGVSGRIVSIVVKGTNGRATIGGGTLRAALGLQDDRVWINRNRQVTGSIRQKYDAIGCRPGLPTSRRVGVAGGERQVFQRGTIYAKDGTGAHALSGPILAYYGKHGGPGGPLGFPVSDTIRLQNGNTRTRFEHGTVTCRPSGSCWRS